MLNIAGGIIIAVLALIFWPVTLILALLYIIVGYALPIAVVLVGSHPEILGYGVALILFVIFYNIAPDEQSDTVLPQSPALENAEKIAQAAPEKLSDSNIAKIEEPIIPELDEAAIREALDKKEINIRDVAIIGIGGAGGNFVNNLLSSPLLEGAHFIVANTDAQALDHARTQHTIQLGAAITKGLGAGANPEIGKTVAYDALPEMMQAIESYSTVFFIAGLGGGTGSGSTPVFAHQAALKGKDVFCAVTLPFDFEGMHKKKLAQTALDEMASLKLQVALFKYQDAFAQTNEKVTFANAFNKIDEAIYHSILEHLLKTRKV